MFHRSEEELIEQAREIHDARQKVIETEEERRVAAAASAAKKKQSNKNKKETAPADDAPKEDNKPKGPPPKRQLDLFAQSDFKEALKERVPRPFVFGPIEFRDLDKEEFQNLGEQWREMVVEQLMNKSLMHGFPDNLCIHGFQVAIKGKTLKRATTILKHARFLRNLKVSPILPPPPKVVQEALSPAEGQEEAA